MKLFGYDLKLNKRSNVSTGKVPWLTGKSSDEITTPHEALTVGAFYACLKVLAETVSTLPCVLYEKLDGGGKERARKHPLFNTLYYKPNQKQNASQFYEMLILHAAMRGNGYAYIDIKPKKTELIPMNPDRVTVKTSNGDLYKYYEYRHPNGTTMTLRPDQVLHVYGLSTDGNKGLSVLDLAMRTLNLAKKQEVYADKMFTNQASPGGILRHPTKLSEQAGKRLKKQFDEKYAGADNAGSTMLLEEGMEWQQIGLTNEQAQFIQGRKFSRADVAMWFRMPPHKIGDLERATFSNIEQQDLSFYVDTIRPWLVKMEQAILMTLFSEDEWEDYTVEFLIEAIIRADINTRYSAYSIARQQGFMCVDEIRAKENMNPLPNGEGKVFLTPLNMATSEEVKKADEEKKKPKVEQEPENEDDTEKEERSTILEVIRPTFVSIMERSLRRKTKVIKSKGASEEVLEKEKQAFLNDIEPLMMGLRTEEKAGELAEIWAKTEGDTLSKSQVDEMLEILKN